MSIATGLTALKTATDLARSLRDRLKSGEVKAEEVIGRIAEIYDYIVESKDALSGAKDEIQELKDENQELRDRLRQAEDMRREKNDFAAFCETLTYDERIGVSFRDVHGTPEAYCAACITDGRKTRLSRAQSGTYVCQYHGFRNAH
jgi:Mg2+ and Co2+ transporter CorA